MDSSSAFLPFTLCCRGRLVRFDRPAMMGILNATADSFYDGGRYNSPDALLAHARQLLAEGAGILDLGVVSSRPGAVLLDPDEETSRLAPLVALLRRELPAETIISVDTCYARPAAAAVEAGADMVNDISGGQFDEQMFPTVASLQVPYIMMHTRGLPAEMQRPENCRYVDIIGDLVRYFSERLDTLCRLGVKDIILDPGFGFAKTAPQCFELLHRLGELTSLFPDRPLLAGLSNKSFLTSSQLSISNSQLPAQPELSTLAANTLALHHGARLLRVHSPQLARIASYVTCGQ